MENFKYKPVNHIAFIMDGNGRWAKKRGLPRSAGHKEGVKRIDETLYLCRDYNIKVMTIFCFSTENWKRDKDEVDYLFKLFDEFFHDKMEEFEKNNCKVIITGEKSRLPQYIQDDVALVEERTKDYDEHILNICLNYGGRDEIVHTAKEIATLVKDGSMKVEDINEQTFHDHMWSKDLPPVDLMVRTSGEVRISNFVLWELAYAEMIFIDDYWPDFKEKQFKQVLEEYTKRDRRFGGY